MRNDNAKVKRAASVPHAQGVRNEKSGGAVDAKKVLEASYPQPRNEGERRGKKHDTGGQLRVKGAQQTKNDRKWCTYACVLTSDVNHFFILSPPKIKSRPLALELIWQINFLADQLSS